jgi:hypothetical protein
VFTVGATVSDGPVTQVVTPSVNVREATEQGMLSVTVEPGQIVFRLALRPILTGNCTDVEITLLVEQL